MSTTNKQDWYTRFKADFFFVMVCYAVITWLSGGYDKDSTDGPNSRSGMILHVDHATGCQYLSVPDSGITPRIGANGKQMCGDVTP